MKLIHITAVINVIAATVFAAPLEDLFTRSGSPPSQPPFQPSQVHPDWKTAYGGALNWRPGHPLRPPSPPAPPPPRLPPSGPRRSDPRRSGPRRSGPRTPPWQATNSPYSRPQDQNSRRPQTRGHGGSYYSSLGRQLNPEEIARINYLHEQAVPAWTSASEHHKQAVKDADKVRGLLVDDEERRKWVDKAANHSNEVRVAEDKIQMHNAKPEDYPHKIIGSIAGANLSKTRAQNTIHEAKRILDNAPQRNVPASQ